MAAIAPTLTEGTAIDLTDVSVNPGASPTSTPRQGGFTLRNRVNFSNVTASNKATFATSAYSAGASAAADTWTVNPLIFLQVPARTLVKDVNVFAVAGQSRPQHAITYSSTAGSSVAAASSDLKVNVLQYVARAWKKSNGTSAATTVVNFGQIDIAKTVSTGSGGAFAGSFLNTSWSASASSKISVPTNAGVRMEKSTVNMALTASTYHIPTYYPYGGYVMLRHANISTSLSYSSASAKKKLKGFAGALSGVWDVQANCNYVPE
jgi:hypothetical protein